MKRLAALVICSGLAACSSLPPPVAIDREQVGDFAIEARFALRVTTPGQAPQSSGGRLNWEHTRTGERILLSSPLGYGLAEIETSPSLSRLRTADHQIRESADAEALMEEVTGHRLPVGRLPAWLLGRTGDASKILRDASGRPQQLTEAGWRIDYAYDEDTAGALPARLTLLRGSEIELRLRIETWRTP